MRTPKLITLTLIFGLFVTANINSAVFQSDQERQNRQEQQEQQERQDRPGQQQQMEHMQQRQERDVEVNQLPQKIQKTLSDDYEDWNPSEAAIVTDNEEHEEGSFYQVKLNKTETGEQETKVVMIDNDGEVIDEKDGEEFERETQQRRDREGQREGQRDREYTPAGYGQERQEQQERSGQQQRENMQQRQERNVELDELPQQVQETLREDYQEWSQTEAAIVTDNEEYEEGSFYQVTLNKTDNGEKETKIVKIARDGEVIDEEDPDNGGWF